MRTFNPLARREQRCCEVRSRLSDYIDGELDREERTRLDRHLRWCPRCRSVLWSLDRTVAALRRLAPEGAGAGPPPRAPAPRC